jgi:hypothetical protein
MLMRTRDVHDGALSFFYCVFMLSLWLMCGIEGAIVAVLLHLVMVATGLVANAWDGGRHYRSPLGLGHGCN